MLYVITLICSGQLSPRECDTSTARAYHASVEPVVVCGMPTSNPFSNSPLAPTESEYLVTRCSARPRR